MQRNSKKTQIAATEPKAREAESSMPIPRVRGQEAGSAAAFEESSIPRHSDSTGGDSGEQSPKLGLKKPYRKPQVRVYGTIETLTASSFVTGADDGGSAGMNRTH